MVINRFAPHLEKCMGMGRNSSRVASRRLAAGNKDSYREGGHDDDEDDDDEWVEPGKRDRPRKRDKNSPRRHKNYLKFKAGEGQDGTITPPQSYDQLCLDERRQLLTNICGVVGNGTKPCPRSTSCQTHSDRQRREVRLKWLGGSKVDMEDVELNSDEDTSALRESLSHLSNASSPAESTVSTSSNPGLREGQRGNKRDKQGKRGKKGRPGSKNGSSRGSTPPLME